MFIRIPLTIQYVQNQITCKRILQRPWSMWKFSLNGGIDWDSLGSSVITEWILIIATLIMSAADP